MTDSDLDPQDSKLDTGSGSDTDSAVDSLSDNGSEVHVETDSESAEVDDQVVDAEVVDGELLEGGADETPLAETEPQVGVGELDQAEPDDTEPEDTEPDAEELAARRRRDARLAAAEDRDPFMKRRTYVVLILALLITYPLVTFLDVWFASTQTDAVSSEAAIVLGAAQYNGSPSPVLEGRLDRAAELFTDGSVPLIVVTGGSQEGDVTTEAGAGYNYLRSEAGLADEDLRLEVQGGSTYESLAATARFLETEDIDEVILVTDPFHAKRAQLTAEEVGLNVEVALTSQSATFERLIEETGAVALGRIITFRRLDRIGN